MRVCNDLKARLRIPQTSRTTRIRPNRRRGQRRSDYGFAGDPAADAGETAGVVVPAGNTPAPESGAAEAAGEASAGVVDGEDIGDDFAAAGDVCGAPWVFISSRRKALSAVPLWA